MSSKITFRYQSRSGALFNVTPAMTEAIDELIDKVITEVNHHKSTGRFIGYLSVPISSRGGGDFETNTNMASAIADRVGKDFGKLLWVLNPAAYDLPKGATGGDYMAVWADVLAGVKGGGDDFDLVYFVGPNDVWNYFGASGADRLGVIEKWLETKAASDNRYKSILEDANHKSKFLRYYGLRGSAAYSKGAHDEWNIVTALNAKRAIGNDIAIYFDGTPIEPGDYGDKTDAGYQAGLLH